MARSPRKARPRTGPPDGSGVGPEPINQALNAAAEHYSAGRVDMAAALYRWIEGRAPDDIRPIYSLAVIDLRQGRFDAARRRLRAVARRDRRNYPAMHNLGVAEQALGGWQAAEDAYRRALDLRPDAIESAFSLAIAEAVLGRTDSAVDRYRRLADDPANRLRALIRLAILRPRAVTETELDFLKDAAGCEGVEAVVRTGVFFAIGAALEIRGDHGGAWAAFTAGNRAKRDSLMTGPTEFRPEEVARQHAQSVDRIRTLFTPQFLAAHGGMGEAGARPIFIIGLPRSGSTLIEQILASHPLAQGMGESATLADTVEGRFPYPPTAPMAPGHFRALARDYLKAQAGRGWNGRARLVDKTLDNHLNVGLIHLMFPKAIVIVARRDPLAVGVACFRQLFSRGAETLYDQSDIAAEIVRYEAMMSHWRDVLPGRVFEVRYESLVTEPEVQIRRLVTEGCMLPWSDACLKFHETSRPVATASHDQVRHPIFEDAVNRWRRYEPWLGPLKAGLRGGAKP